MPMPKRNAWIPRAPRGSRPRPRRSRPSRSRQTIRKATAAAGLMISSTGKTWLAALLIALAGCALAFGQPAKPQASGPQAPAAQQQARTFQFALQNGLQVLVVPDHRSPVVTQMLWFRVGSVDDPPGLSGMAH